MTTKEQERQAIESIFRKIILNEVREKEEQR